MSLNMGWFLGIFVVYLLINLFVAIKVSKGTSGIGQFALGNVGAIVLAFSFFATRLSASTYLGEPGFCWATGWPYSWIGIFNAAFWLATILVVARRMRQYSGALGSLTVPDFLGKRYGSDFLRIWTSIGCTVFYIMLMVAQYKGIVALFTTLFGLNKVVVIIVFSIIALLYVNIGGFKSVAWTDFIQGVLMVAIAIVVFLSAFKAVGWSFADVKKQLANIDPELVKPVASSGLYDLAGVICLPFYLFVSLVSNPYCTIRLMALTDVNKSSFKKFGITLLSIGMICMLMYCTGIFGRVLFPNLTDADNVVPTIALNYLPQWMLAVFAVGLFAAIMSTVDSMLHCVSSMISLDVYKRTINKSATDKQVASVARYSSIVCVLIVLVITFFWTPEFLSMLGLIAAAGSGLITLSPLLVGLYWDRTSKAGAIAGSLVGVGAFAFFYWIMPINTWARGVVSAIIAIVVTIVVSLLTKPVDATILKQMRCTEVANRTE